MMKKKIMILFIRPAFSCCRRTTPCPWSIYPLYDDYNSKPFRCEAQYQPVWSWLQAQHSANLSYNVIILQLRPRFFCSHIWNIGGPWTCQRYRTCHRHCPDPTLMRASSSLWYSYCIQWNFIAYFVIKISKCNS